MNPASIMKMMKAKNTFTANHPKFVSFLQYAFGSGIPADSVIEITVTKPGQEPVTSNIRVLQSDLELLDFYLIVKITNHALRQAASLGGLLHPVISRPVCPLYSHADKQC